MSYTKKKLMYCVFACISLVLMYLVNYLGSATSLLGVGMHNLSLTFPFDFMPPGFVFSFTWSFIFLTQAIFFVHMWQRHQSHSSALDEKEYRYFLLITWLNTSWVLCTANGWYWGSIAIIFLLLIALFLMLKLMRKRKQNNRWFTFDSIVWGIYYGWITIASLVLSTSQALILLHQDIVFSPLWAWSIVGVTGIFVIMSRIFTKNRYAMIWSLCVLGLIVLLILKVI